MTKQEQVTQLRADTEVHYNCCQSVLIPFCGECGIDRDTAFRLGKNFNNGMKMGSVCGALVGALMVLGMTGADGDKATRLREEFKTRHNAVDCTALLQKAREAGIPRKLHCDGMVFEAVELLEELLGEESKKNPGT